jgi:uncharacterized membrane protein YesL
MRMREKVLIAVISIAILLIIIVLGIALTYVIPEHVNYADSYNKTIVIVVGLGQSFYSEVLNVTLKSLTNNSTYAVSCIRNSLYRGISLVRYLCNASHVAPGIYAIEIYKPIRIEGTVVVR